jgi:hypothetical protein
MSAEIARFVRIANGPQRLNAKLRVYKRSLAALPAQTRNVRQAGTRLSDSLLGGPILDVLGRRLRQMLDEQANSGSVANRPLRRDFSSSGQPDMRSHRVEDFVAMTPVAARSSRESVLLRDATNSQRRLSTWPVAVSPDRPPLVPELAAPTFPAPPTLARPWSDGSVSAPRTEATTAPPPAKPARPTARSRPALHTLLRQYWLLADDTRAGNGARGVPDQTAPHPPAWPLPQVSDGDHSAGWSEVTAGSSDGSGAGARPDGEAPPGRQPWSSGKPGDGRNIRGWPQAAAARAVDQLRVAAGPGAVSFRSRQQFETGAAEKLEIQNVFNVEVHVADDGPEFDDLGDQLAAILHEQALQHGVDVP